MKRYSPENETHTAWQRIEKNTYHAVGQIFAQGASFNWAEPYLTGAAFENVGTGFLIDTEGHIVTSWHVIEQAKSVWAQFPSTGRMPLTLSVKSVCPEKDIALLQLSRASLKIVRDLLGCVPCLPFGNSDEISRADNVMILGYPLMQYRIKSSTGIISGKEMMGGQSFIQITAPINPGNSGGPVLDELGRVIGITTSLVPEAQNVGYCVPSQDYFTIKDDLMRMSFVRRPVFGVQFVSANDSKALLCGNPLPAGLYVSDVFKEGLCAQADIRPGDMIYQIDECVLDAYGEAQVPWAVERVSFYELIGRIKTGQLLSILLYRNGKKIKKQITIEARDIFAIAPRYPGYDCITYVSIAGLVIMELTENHLSLFMQERPELGKFWQLQDRLASVLVISSVLPGSYSSLLRILSAGDVISYVNKMAVATLNDLEKAVAKRKDFLIIETDLHLEQVIPYEQVQLSRGVYHNKELKKECVLCKKIESTVSKNRRKDV